jgi:P-type Ca2+ transporter type 2C
VGFAMGIAGTEVAKEASAIILMDDNFTSIVKALKWGRAVNDAVKRFLQFQLTVNVTAVVLTFVSAVSNSTESSVLTAVQLLWVNLIMDTLAALALATDPPQDSVLDRKPERKGSSIISTTMWKMILGQAVYQLAITFMIYFGKDAVYPVYSYTDLPTYDDINAAWANGTITQQQYNANVTDIDAARRDAMAGEDATLVFNTFVWMQIFNQWNNRRLDNRFNIFEGLTKNWFFIAISAIMCGGQVLIVMVGGKAFNITKQSSVMWAYAIVLGVLSIPAGFLIRLVPDRWLEALVPEWLKRRAQSKVPGLTISDDEERFSYYPEPLADVRDELTFLKRIKGGRINNLKFAMKHPREAFSAMKSPSNSREHSRSNSIHRLPQTPTREDSFGSQSGVPTPDSRKRSRSMRSRSNSALGAATVMSGIVAGSIAAGWSPVDRRGEPDYGQFPRPSPPSNQGSQSDAQQASQPRPPSRVLEEQGITDEPQDIAEAGPSNTQNVPILSVPGPLKSPALEKPKSGL